MGSIECCHDVITRLLGIGIDRLESQLQGKLDRPRPANLVKRAESTSAHIRASEALCEYLGREAKIGLADISNGRTEVWMIQNIEHFCPKLQLDGFMDGKVPVDCEIPFQSSKAAKSVPSQITLSKRFSRIWVRRRRHECCRIECFSSWKISEEVQWLARHDVRADPVESLVKQSENTVVGIHRRSRSGQLGNCQWTSL